MLQHIAKIEKTKALLLSSIKHYEKCFQTACAENCQLTEKVTTLSNVAQVISPALYTIPYFGRYSRCITLTLHLMLHTYH